LFFRNTDKPARHFQCTPRGQGFGVEDRDGSEMAPQGVENAKNGLGNGEPPAQCLMIRLRNLSFRRASAQGPCNQAQEAKKVARKRT
jgi:hypothetical protein